MSKFLEQCITQRLGPNAKLDPVTVDIDAFLARAVVGGIGRKVAVQLAE